MSAQAMQSARLSDMLIRLIPGQIEMTPATAQSVLQIQFPESDHERMRELLRKSQADELNTPEREELDNYGNLGCFLGILHSKARKAIRKAGS